MKNKRLLGLILLFAGYFILFTVNDLETFSIDFLLTVVSTVIIGVGYMIRSY